jgi:hypothetical protein
MYLCNHKNGISKSAVLVRLLTSIPSSTSTVVSNDDDDSMERTPSGPTLLIASAIMVPIKSSFPADIAAIAETEEYNVYTESKLAGFALE